MADRQTGQRLRLHADLGLGLAGVEVQVFDALGASAGQAVAGGGQTGRYTAELPVDSRLIEGRWQARWSWSGPREGSVEQAFTVGAGGGVSKWEARASAATQVGRSHLGQVSSAGNEDLLDDALSGGVGDYTGLYLLPDPAHPEAGHYRRVAGFNGAIIELSTPFVVDLVVGERYLLCEPHPEEIERAFAYVFDLLGPLARVPVRARLSSLDGEAPVPAGWRVVGQVFLRRGAEEPVRVRNTDWQMLPGRRLHIAHAGDGDEVLLFGARDGAAPRWEDSRLDLDVSLVVTNVVAQLHKARSRGPATDADDHMRRAVMALQEAQAITARRVRRAVQNGKPVLD